MLTSEPASSRVHPDFRTLRLREVEDASRDGRSSLCGSSAVEAALESVPPGRHVLLGERQRPPCRHFDLQPHQVEPGDGLRHRVLDLQTGVHLEEERRPVGSEQELDGAAFT